MAFRKLENTRFGTLQALRILKSMQIVNYSQIHSRMEISLFVDSRTTYPSHCTASCVSTNSAFSIAGAGDYFRFDDDINAVRGLVLRIIRKTLWAC